MPYILDRQGKTILDELGGDNVFWDDKYSRNIHNTEKYEFKILPNCRAAQYMGYRNRVIIQTGDGFFREFIILQTELTLDYLEVQCVGAQLELAEDEPFPVLKREGDTINSIIDYALSQSRWERGNTDYTKTLNFTTDAYKTPLQIINKAGSEFDVELRFRIEIEGSKILGRYVDAVKKREPFRGREILHGRDLVNITKTTDTAEVHTALVGMTPEKEDGTQTTVEVKNEPARQVWGVDGKHRWDIYEPQSDNQDMTEAQIRSYTERELEKRIAAAVEYEVDAVDLEYVFGFEHEKIRMGDRVRIVADDLNPGLYLWARVIAVETSVADPSQKKFTLGDFIEVPEQDILNVLNQIKRKVNQKANKTLIDENGEESGGLNGIYDNFGQLYVGQFASPTVPMKSQADIKLYVSDRAINDGNEPSDDNDGQSFDNPLETVSEAIRRIPEQLDHEARIVMAYDGDFYEYIRINGISGSGKIVLNGQYKWGTTLHSGIRFRGTQVDVEVREMHIICGSDYEVFSTNAGTTQFIDCNIKGQPSGETTTHGLIAFDNGVIKTTGCNFYNLKNGQYAYDGGRIINTDNKGSVEYYGLRARTGGIITGTGTAPTGAYGGYIEYDGGFIPNPEDFTFNTETDQSSPKTQTVTKEWKATDSGTYTVDYGGVWDSVIGSDVTQGEYGSLGPYRGIWTFGSGPSNTVKNKNIKQIRIKVKRRDKSGSGQAVDLHFRTHNYTSIPSGKPLMSGTTKKMSFKRLQERYVKLPESMHAVFESGAGKGIGIYSESSDYTKMYGGATLEITYEE